MGPEQVSQRTAILGFPAWRDQKAWRNVAARAGAWGTAPAARASSTTPSVPLRPTRPPIPAMGFTRNPMRCTPRRGPRVYFAFPRWAPDRASPEGRQARARPLGGATTARCAR